jgi:hypothetical protein
MVQARIAEAGDHDSVVRPSDIDADPPRPVDRKRSANGPGQMR